MEFVLGNQPFNVHVIHPGYVVTVTGYNELRGI